jgi:S-formylglutathione hydrolase FrmB
MSKVKPPKSLFTSVAEFWWGPLTPREQPSSGPGAAGPGAAGPSGGAAGASMAGHAKQEASELVNELEHSVSRLAVLDREARSATGFAFKKLPVGEGLPLSPTRANAASGPAPELTRALGALDKRAVLLPEVYSAAAGRNVRFAAILPAKFELSRAQRYPVVAVLPDAPPGSTVAELLAGGFVDRASARLQGVGLKDAIVLLPERFEHRPGAAPEAELDKLARAVIREDLAPWAMRYLNASYDPVKLARTDLTPASAASPGAPSPGVDAAPKSEPKGFFDFRPKLLKDLEKKDDAVLVRDRGGVEVSTLEDAEKVLRRGGSAVALPDASDLERLKERKAPTLLVAKLELGGEPVPVSVVLPPGYDPQRARGYRPVVVAPSPELSARDVAKQLLKAGTSLEDSVLIVPDLTKKEVEAAGGDTAAARALLESGALSSFEGLNVDFSRYASAALGADGKVREAALSQVELPGTMMSVRGTWRMLAPRVSYKEAYPAEPSVIAATESIPVELQRQPETRGTFFAPVIDSRAIRSPMRVGVYLPPGYDPATQEKYPVLVLLPGKGNTLNVWTSEGQLTPKLDKLMAGDAQKMIVVVAGNTDSFWFDYDKNGKGKFGTPGRRDFEGLVMDELLDYATRKLKGDGERLSIGGISRGGFGAMQLALRHPDRFKSVSAHSAPLALEHHEGVVGNMGAKTMVEHLGEAGAPVWRQFNPADLVQDGALEKAKAMPRMLVDVGAQEPYFLDESLRFGALAQERGAPVTLRVLSKEGAELKHNWELWGSMLETWVSFHQAAHGQAGKPKVPAGIKDVAEKASAEHAERRAERLASAMRSLGQSVMGAQRLKGEAAALLAEPSDHQPFEPAAAAGAQLAQVVRRSGELVDAARRFIGSGHELHVVENFGQGHQGWLKELEGELAEAKRKRASGLGERPPARAADPGAIGRLPAAHRAALAELMAMVPETRAPLALLATVRPELLTRFDPKSGGAFAMQLRDFVRDGKLNEGEGPGLAEFIRRVAVRRFDWRRSGYSRSTCSAMLTVFNHPGLILNLVRAARDGNAYEVKGVYSGDGARRLPPRDDWKAGFSGVDGTAQHPPADLGYERAWLRTVVDDLSSSPQSFPPERFAAGCDADAVGLSKLIGEEVHYRYAFNLRTGADLVKALATQGEEGLAMADVKLRLSKDGDWHNLHFPVFYDHDPVTGTVAFQHWSQGERRIPVKDLEFIGHGDARPAIFMRGPESAMFDFLTPWEQKNWSKIKDSWKGPLPEALRPKPAAPSPPDAKGPPGKPQGLGVKPQVLGVKPQGGVAKPEPSGAPTRAPGTWYDD